MPASANIVLPGFIDVHVHGGGGRDTMEGGDAAGQIGRLHVRHGTTSMLATTMTAPLEEIRSALSALGPFCAQRAPGSAACSACTSKAPTSTPASWAPSPTSPSPRPWPRSMPCMQLAPIRLITLAPELPGTLELIAELRAEGFQVQIGHTAGTYEDGVQALQHGAGGFTHLFNAMSGLHHREPGMVGAALAHASTPRSSRTCCMCTPAPSAWPCARSRACSASPIPRPRPACPMASTAWAATA